MARSWMARARRLAAGALALGYLDESRLGGQMVKSRHAVRVLGPNACGFRWEILGQDGQWKTISEGTTARVKGR